jgi:hypothetical protein
MTIRPLLLTVALTLAACGAPTAVASPSGSVSPSQAASSASPVSLGPFTCSDRAGGVHNSAANLSALRIAHQPGFDRITFEFTTPQDVPASLPFALPEYQLTQQATTQFFKDGSGQAVTLAGSAGLHIVFHGATGYNTYAGSHDLKPTVVLVSQVSQLGDFERTLSWGVGLNRQACYRTVELSNPTRLAIDFQTPQAAG